jgi:homoserine dehydrogenase
MQPVNIGIIGLGNVGLGTLDVLAENSELIAQKLGFPLCVVALCSRHIAQRHVPAAFASALCTSDWREVVNHSGPVSRAKSSKPPLRSASPW